LAGKGLVNMSDRQTISTELISLARSLRNVADDFVVIGGVATFLYDFHKLADPNVAIRTTYTYDIDLAVGKVRKLQEEKIHEKIQALGFNPQESRLMDSPKPLTKFVKQVEDEQLEIEFLVPLVGSEIGRDGKAKIIFEISSHITAQQLRYLDILIDDPARLPLEDISGDPTDKGIFLQIPGPANYLLHKFITLSLRNSIEDKQKDAFYIYDFLNRFEKNWPEILNGLLKVVEKYKKQKVVRNFFGDFQKFFSTPSSEGVLLLLEEHRRTYSSSYSLSAEQVVGYVRKFMKDFDKLTSK
jgi:hypothetical protein